MKRSYVIIYILLWFLFFSSSCTGKSHDKKKRELKWLSYEDGLIKARKDKKHTIIFFNADWCYWCRKMMKEFTRSEKIFNYLNNNFSLVLVNVDEEYDLLVKYDIVGVPTLVFLQPNSEEISQLNYYPGEDEFLNILKYVKEEHYKKMTFKEYKKKMKKNVKKI